MGRLELAWRVFRTSKMLMALALLSALCLAVGIFQPFAREERFEGMVF
jgi:hypothetical protein